MLFRSMNVIEPGEVTELEKIKLRDEGIMKVMMRKDKVRNTKPKRSLITPEIIERQRKLMKKDSNNNKGNHNIEEEKKFILPKSRDEINEGTLVRDLTSLVDIYKDSSQFRKDELMESIGNLKDKISMLRLYL